MISIAVATGFMCRHVRSSGYSEDKMRVRYWRAASKRWTLPTLVDASDLTGLNEADYKKHGPTIKRGSEAALALKLVGRVWS